MNAERLHRVQRLRKLADLLDSSIRLPGTSWRIGLDPLVGLIPGIGDAAGLGLSSWIVMEAYQLGVPRSTLLRMSANLGVDALVGSVPLLGDLFDAGFKANQRNIALLERALRDLELRERRVGP